MSKFKPKNKKKILPKLWAGGSIYDDQANYGNDVAGVQKVTSSRPLESDRTPIDGRTSIPNITAPSTQGTPSSMTIDANKSMQSQGSGEGSQGEGMSANQAAGYAQMAGGIARAISAGSNKRDPNDFRSKQIAQEDAIATGVGQVVPIFKPLYDMGQSIGDPIRQSAEAMDKQAAEKGQAKLANKDEAASMAVVGGIFDPFKALQARSSYEGGWTDITGQGYAKHLEKVEQQRLDEMNKPKREAELADTKNKLQYGTFTARKGGVYPTNAIPMHGNEGAWAIPLFSNGGQTFQVDGPSHEQGGVVIPTPNGDVYEVEKEEVIKREPNADKILSDKLIDKSTGKTYALSQKPYEKLKEQVEKFKNDNAKSNAEELASVRFDEGYNKQEMEKSLKQKLQLEKDFFKCGGMVKYKDGGIHIKPENRGKFTAAANRAGMGVQEYANHILANREDFSSTLVKRANFAHNAASWKKEDGGPVQDNTYVSKNKQLSEKDVAYAMSMQDKYKEFKKTLNDKNSVVTIPTSKGYNYPDSTTYYPGVYSNLGTPYVTTTLGARLKGVGGLSKDQLYELYKNNPNIFNVRKDSIEYENTFKYEDGGYQPLSNPYKGMTIPIFQDGGPKGTKPLGYDDAIQIDPSKLPGDYNFTQRTTEDLGGGRTKVTNLYNKPVTDKPIPSTNPGSPSPDWENAIIKRLQAGESPDDLRKSGFIGDEGVKKYSKYYRPLKTVITQEAPKQEARLYGEKTIAGKLQPRGYAEQPWDTYRTWPEAGKANVYTDVNYHQGKPIDVNKSFDSAGNFKPYYLNNNATGTYLQQQGTEMNRNPLPVLPGTETRNMMSYSVNRYGGMQKFDDGGSKSKKDPEAEAALEAFWRSQYGPKINPNNPYGSTYDFNMPVGGPLDQAILRDKNQSYASDGMPANAGTPSEPTKYVAPEEMPTANTANTATQQNPSSPRRFDYNALNSGLGVLANSAGPLAYMMGEGKGYDRQQFYEYTPSELDFTPTERAYMARRRAVLNNVKNLSGGHSGAALSNIAAQNADLNQSEDTAMREFANQMASIRNQAQQFNIQGQYSVDDINARNKGQALTNYYKSIGQLGTNTASGMRDYRAGEMDQQQLNMMSDFFNNYYYDKASNSWKFKK